MSLDPISVLQSPMSLILQKTHNSLLAGDTHLSKSKPKLTANVEMQMEQQIKTYFSFFPRPRLRVYNKSLLSQVPRTASVAGGQELLTHHNVPITQTRVWQLGDSQGSRATCLSGDSNHVSVQDS